LLDERLSSRYSVTFTTKAAHTDAIVVLTKGYLVDAPSQSLAGLRTNQNILLADPVDLGMTVTDLTALAATVDGFVASSQRQLAALKDRFPEKPCHLVTHNVDRRLPAFAPPSDKLRVAYVGLPKNCRYREKLSYLADIVETPTGRSSDTWINRLPEFNCHYALRRDDSLSLKSFLADLLGRSGGPIIFSPSRQGLFSRPTGFFEFKPFTKGFTAAHSGSPVLAERNEGDTQFYLPDDYPFFLPGGTWNEVSAALRQVAGEFGGMSWKYALDVMRDVRDRSSPSHIANEFKTMLAHYR
jgi:hypothetical protein